MRGAPAATINAVPRHRPLIPAGFRSPARRRGTPIAAGCGGDVKNTSHGRSGVPSTAVAINFGEPCTRGAAGESVPLIRLVELAQRLRTARGVPALRAAELLLESLGKHPQLDLYLLQPSTWAEQIAGGRIWPRVFVAVEQSAAPIAGAEDPAATFAQLLRERKATPRRPEACLQIAAGVPGALAMLRKRWINTGSGATIPQADQRGQPTNEARLAIRADLAAELFGFGDPAAAPTALSASPAPVLPLHLVKAEQAAVSAAPPLQKAPLRQWSEADKQAMRQDRACGLSDEAIGRKFGVSRQRIAELIGSKAANRQARATRQA